MSDLKYLIAGVIGGAVVFGAGGVACIALIHLANMDACSNAKRLYGYETDVTPSLGCMVKRDGQWVSVDVVTRKKLEVTVK